MNEETVFYLALEKPPNERAAVLDAACQADADLRARVELLLTEHERQETFILEHLPAELHARAESTPGERPGASIGPYKLLEQIGEGGFGVVFLAEQERPVRRRVALKVIKPGMDTREVIARFEAERQALALMDHPHIAKVHDAGATEHGRPYFVMELVQGVPITEYCDRCNLTTRERLELFVAVCQAVQHAHQQGIIHRDIKPNNVLVAIQDGKPAPKVIDFGVAKAINRQLTERTLMTAFAQIVGTPLYMSPEQAELSPLGVDTRSDVYSLGVLLYELLTGATPFDKERLQAASYDELRRIIREEEPPRPSARLSTLNAEAASTVADHRRTDVRHLRQAVRGELDWIVMKCLEKDRNRRYESAGSLARDVERYLHDEPVLACPPSVVYRLSTFMRRNRGGVLAAAAIAASLLITSTVSTWLYVREREARRQAEFGSQILDIASSFHGASPEETEMTLAAISTEVERMDRHNQARFYYRLGDLRGRQTYWDESAKFFAKGLSLEADRTVFEPFHYYLPVLVQCGDLNTYQQARRQLVEQFGKTTDPRVAECVVKDALFLPWPDANFDLLSKLCDTALHAEDHWAKEHFEFCKGLLEYRRGNYDLAALHAYQGNVTNNAHLVISAAMVRAMALHRLGHADEARELLSYGFEFGQAKYLREMYLAFDRNWNDWIVTQVFMNEAAGLIDTSLLKNVPKSLATAGNPTAAVDNLYYLALEKLHSADESGYREACVVLDLVPGDTPNHVTEFRRVWTWCLGPHPQEGLAEQLSRAKQLVANDTLEESYAEHLLLGATLYRMGRYKSAAKHLEASIAAYPSQPRFTYGTVLYPRLVLSMVKARLDQTQEAARLLADCQPAIKLATQSPSTLWDYRTAIEILNREAQSLMKPNEPARNPSNGHPTPGLPVNFEP